MGFGNISRVRTLLSSLPYFFLFLLPNCIAIDTISTGQSITDGETLVSSGNIFELGFFSPGNSTNRYVGIWYKKTSYTQVVGVLNAMKPILDSHGSLSINNEGNLVILDGKQNVIWYTNASSMWSNTSTVAILDDMGNFALRDNHLNVSLWDSFDHPSNTLIPNMKLGGNDKLGISLRLTSWVSENNPAPGKFFLRRNRQEAQQVYIVSGSAATIVNGSNLVKHWNSGQWNGRSFIGIPEMPQDYINGITFSSDGNGGEYYTYSLSDTSNISLAVLLSSGNIETKNWDEQKKEWVVFWLAINSQCDAYGACGPFGVCNKMESFICSCMRGFQPKFPEKWRNGNWSDGCERSTPLQCGSGSEGFLKLEGIKLPDVSEYLLRTDENECKVRCLNNCSCLAYSFVSGAGCLVWTTELIDVQQYSSGGQDLYLRLPSSLLGANTSDLVKARESFSSSVQDVEDPEIQFSHVKLGEDQELQLFDFDSVKMATNNFSFCNKIGEGGFGIVYKGDLSSGQAIAVKRLSRTSGQGITEFKNEIMLISKLQHRNLVKLVGVCIEGEEKLLLYEYLSNKSLDKFLFDPTQRAELDWTTRFKIIEGVACGLLYLHRDSRLRVIHRDLKTSNILLDEQMNPKISDFGMARIFGVKQDLANTNRVVGTYGYMAPEYGLEGIFSEKSDVFSFGICLLEIVSGAKNSSFCHDEEHLSFLGYAWKLWNTGKGMQLIDQTIVDSCDPLEAMRCIHIGLLCAQDYAVDRPTMSKVVYMLSTETTDLTPPKMPLYIRDNKDYINLSSHGSDVNSINECSITAIESR
ncbi:G-type lectin S-receptor-like serine/threonine-protein kinase B120 [Telopea speciosissima]|uniref:G-type lectin S-receptor-like serine/threonine-protein kinase B120 n=1 Tax=Telopea speciosissima TaxID=54955 RepID=UPI001CC4D70C|nr:G-type lectin S-receptor-like serine/threonine-protein kinase B120 [Telopea speciosissima]